MTTSSGCEKMSGCHPPHLAHQGADVLGKSWFSAKWSFCIDVLSSSRLQSRCSRLWSEAHFLWSSDSSSTWLSRLKCSLASFSCISRTCSSCSKEHTLPKACSLPEWKSLRRLRSPSSISLTSETSVRKECCRGEDWATLLGPAGWGALGFSLCGLVIFGGAITAASTSLGCPGAPMDRLNLPLFLGEGGCGRPREKVALLLAGRTESLRGLMGGGGG